MTRLSAGLTAAAALCLSGCASADDWSRPHAAPTAVGALGAGFVEPGSTPAPESTVSPSPGSWDDVCPPEGYRVVVLTLGDDAPTATLADAVERWAGAGRVSLRTVHVTSPEHEVAGIVEAIDLRPDLVVAASPGLVDALALVTASHLDQQFLVLGAQLPEPTENVTAAVWPGAESRGSEVANLDGAHVESAFTPERGDDAVRAGVASVLSGLTGIVVALP